MPELAYVAPSGGMIPLGPGGVTPPTQSLTLYELEEHLAALADSTELVPVEQEQQFLADFQAALTKTVEKRDRVGHFLSHVEQQIAFASSEVKRLQERKQFFERVQERVEQMVIGIIVNLGPDAKGKYPKLEGKTVTFSVRKCPVSVEVTDETLVPQDYLVMSMRLPANTWEALLDALDVEFRAQVLEQIQSPDVAVSKTALKKALEGGTVVSGAHLVTDKKSLVRK